MSNQPPIRTSVPGGPIASSNVTPNGGVVYVGEHDGFQWWRRPINFPRPGLAKAPYGNVVPSRPVRWTSGAPWWTWVVMVLLGGGIGVAVHIMIPNDQGPSRDAEVQFPPIAGPAPSAVHLPSIDYRALCLDLYDDGVLTSAQEAQLRNLEAHRE